jgi:preprotein translocase subunit YajC
MNAFDEEVGVGCWCIMVIIFSCLFIYACTHPCREKPTMAIEEAVQPLKVGDKVKLKTGYLVMTIESFSSDNTVNVVFEYGGEVKKQSLKMETIER